MSHTRKRTQFNHDSHQPLKKLKTTTDELETTVLQEQNNRLTLKVHDQQREIDDLQRTKETLKNELIKYDSTINMITQYWNSLDEDLILILKRLDPLQQVSLNSNKQQSHTFLQMLLESYDNISYDDKKNIDLGLKKRSNFTKNVLTAVVEAILNEHKKNLQLSQLKEERDPIKKREAVLQTLRDENSKMRQQISELTNQVELLQVKHRNMSNTVNSLKESVIINEKKLKEAENELELTKFELRDSQKKVDQLKQQLNQKEKQLLKENQENSVKQVVVTGGDEQTKLLISELQAELAQKNNQYENGMKELEAKSLEVIKLKHELEELKNKKEEAQLDIHQNKQYQALEEKYSETLRMMDGMKKKIDDLYAQLKICDARRREDQECAEKNEQKRRAELMNIIQDRSKEITELKKEISQLKHELKKAKARSDRSAEIDNLHKTLSIQQRELNRYREELKLYTSKDLNLDELVKRNLSLEKLVSEKRAEIDKLEQKQRQLESEIKALYERIDMYKSSDTTKKQLVEIQASEQELKEKVVKLEKELVEKSKQKDLTSEDIQKQIHALKEELEGAKEESKMYQIELENMAAAFGEIQENNTKLTLQIAEKENTNAQLLNEKLKTQQIVSMLKQQQKSREEVEEAQKKVIDSLKQQLEKFQITYQCIVEENRNLKEEIYLKGQQADRYRNEAIEANHNYQEWKAKGEKALKQAKEAQKKLIEVEEQLNAVNFRAKKLEDECDTLRSKVKRLQENSKGDLDSELEYLRSQLKCPVCSTNKKNTVIARCFHVFCRDCVKATIQARNRKCPSCNTKFGEKDVHEIFL